MSHLSLENSVYAFMGTVARLLVVTILRNDTLLVCARMEYHRGSHPDFLASLTLNL